MVLIGLAQPVLANGNGGVMVEDGMRHECYSIREARILQTI